MDRSFPFLVLVWFIFGFFSNFLILVYGNLEGDALNAQKEKFTDPTNVLHDWDATLVYPCTWPHVTCNNENSVTRVDLQSANLSGQLVRELGQLSNLQYLELSNNNITGKIPSELGNLTQLVSLDLFLNQLDGDIPATLGKLQKLRFLRLNNNKLRGKIPGSLTTIYTLQVLELGRANLSGQLVPDLGQLRNLQYLELSNNNITGKIPSELGNLTQLEGLNLNQNQLDGAIPATLGKLQNLRYLELYNNKITGKIPSELGNLTQLVSLDLYLNQLDGDIPTTLGNLQKLQSLCLNNNKLRGTIPSSLTTIYTLQVLDLSSNLLSGDIPVNGSFTNFTKLSFINNTHLIFLPPVGQEGNRSTTAIAGGVAAGAALLFGTLIALAWWWCRQPPDRFFDLPAEEDPANHLGQLKRFSLHELQVATDNFSKNKILGRGGFGHFYKGRLADGRPVAVKRLKKECKNADELQFQTEVELISLAVHRNLLRLIGFCMTQTERLLVYPYMVNGSVASCLKGRPNTKPALDWATRKRIAVGSARGLAYLHDHCTPKIIHRDVRAANIMLDEEFEAVVGDFGLARVMDYKATHATTAVRGTIGHIAPEYISTGRASEKTDVYGYGVMLLELITGKQANDLARLQKDDSVMLLDWVKGLLEDKKLETLVDADLEVNGVNDDVERLIQIALLCTQERATERPNMSEVIRMLEGDGLANKWEEWQKEDISPQKFSNTDIQYPYSIQIISNYTPSADQLSAPR